MSEPTRLSMKGFDHIALTVADVEATCEFYTRALGMIRTQFGNGRSALHFGAQKINLSQVDAPSQLGADRPTVGSADLCFVTDARPSEVVDHFNRLGVPILEGPIEREGAAGLMTSVYVRDPDGNLIEVAHYARTARDGFTC